MRSSITMEASQDEQQNQTIITNNNYVQNLCPFLKKKLTKKVKIASDKSEVKQNNMYFTRKDI